MEVFRSLLVQLLRGAKINWLPLFSDLVERKNRGADPPADLDILTDLLMRAAGLHKRPIIVIDALDECNDLSNLLEVLTRLDNGHLQLFCVSRPEIVIQEAFAGLPSISLSDMIEPLLEDMRRHILAELDNRQRLKILRADLKDRILAVLLGRAGGMSVTHKLTQLLQR